MCERSWTLPFELHLTRNAPLEADLKRRYADWTQRCGVLDWKEAFPRLRSAWGIDDPSG